MHVKKTPMARLDNKTTEGEEEEEEAGWEESAASLIIWGENSEKENSAYRYGAN